MNITITTTAHSQKCQTCNDNGYFYVHGVIDVPVRFNCECNPKSVQDAISNPEQHHLDSLKYLGRTPSK